MITLLKGVARAKFASDEQLQEVHDRLFDPILPVPQKKTELGVVFGGTATSGFAARFAAGEFHAGRFDKIVVAGGAPTDDKLFRGAMRLFDRESLKAIKVSDYDNDLTEEALMREVLLEARVPDEAIEVVGKDRKHMDGVVDSLLRSEFVAAADSMSVIAYGPGAQRIRSTIRFQNGNADAKAHFDTLFKDAREKPAFEGAIVPMVAGVGKMQPDNWRESLIARFYVMAEGNNMDPKRAGRGGYIDKYCMDPAAHREQEDALVAALPDFVRR